MMHLMPPLSHALENALVCASVTLGISGIEFLHHAFYVHVLFLRSLFLNFRGHFGLRLRAGCARDYEHHVKFPEYLAYRACAEYSLLWAEGGI